MIKNVLIPEKIGSYYLFGKRILGFDIGKTHVNATQVYLSGSKINIEKCLHEPLELGNQATYQEKVAKAISIILSRADKCQGIYTGLSSLVVVVKTLKLPFTSYEKISLVINYEIEPLLPFSLEDALIDFIITRQIPEDKSAEILVVAVQKQYVIQHMQLFQEAGITPTKISVDLIDLYALFRQIPSYAQLSSGIALIDLGFSATRIAYIYNGTLRGIRTLPKGTSRYAKIISDKLAISLSEANSMLLRFGLEPSENDAYNQTVTDILQSTWQEIQFTLSSFAAKDAQEEIVHAILLLGGGSELKGLPAFVKKLTGITCEQFSLAGLNANKSIKITTKNAIPTSMAFSVAAALPSPITEHFTLRKKEFALNDSSLFTKQLIVAVLLLGMIFSLLLGNLFIQQNKLSHELYSSQEEIISTLKQIKEFKLTNEDVRLDDIIEKAQEETKKEEDTWFAFSNQARSSFLKYLLALHNLDKEGLGLEVERISINNGIMTLKAKVKDYNALKKLEKDLKKSPLFKYVEPQEKTDFTMNITLAKKEES